MDASSNIELQVGAVAKVAEAISERIISGALLPGTHLVEDPLRAELGVSRSTLREGFRMLIQDRLLVHRLSRGFFVRELTPGDISDLYLARRALEGGALRLITTLEPSGLRRLSMAVDAGRTAADEKAWQGMASASITFHISLVALARSVRMDTAIRQILTEFRLAFVHMQDPRSFHIPFFKRHEALADLIKSGRLDEAEESLEKYLLDSENALLNQIE